MKSLPFSGLRKNRPDGGQIAIFSSQYYYQVSIDPYKLKLVLMPACGKKFYTKSLGTFLQSSQKIQPECEKGFTKYDNARQKKIA